MSLQNKVISKNVAYASFSLYEKEENYPKPY